MVPPLITLEEHFFSSAVLDSLDQYYAEQFKNVPELADKLRDLDGVRLSHMDAGRVSLQIISHGPGNPTSDQCREANDQLAAAVKKHSARFAGFAVLPMSDPTTAAQELTRCVTELKFVGTLIDSHTKEGVYYDSADYLSFWSTVQQLNVPIYIHPTWPTESHVTSLYSGDYSTGAAISLGSSGWGWHSDVALHLLRLFASGLFDKFPKLKIIIGHFGEMIPFQFERLCVLSRRWGTRTRDFRQVWNENIWITTSGVWALDPMPCILRNTKVERILYSVDYPFAKNEDGLKWVEDLEKSGLVTQEELEQICHKNAEGLLGVKVAEK